MTEYKKNLGIKESTSIVVSRIIGSGIFRTPAPIMALVGCTSLFGLVWVLGGIITIFGAVVYAELTAMIPKSGGPYVFLKEAYGPYVAFLRGWAMFFVSETASIVAVSLVFTEFINAIFQIITGTPFGIFPTFVLSLFTIWLLTIINLFGVSLSGKFQVVFGVTKIAAVGAIIGITLTVWCIYFFRNPTRVTPILSGSNANNLIISPADGKVIEISEITPSEEIGLPEGKWKRVCIFMNVFDVHVNRSPMLGQITYKKYVPGSFFNASLDKASDEKSYLD